MRASLVRSAAVVSSFALSSGALAQNAVQWRVDDGGNGHWYAVTSESLVHPQLRSACEARGGHLATLTSQAEWQWVKTNLPVTGLFVGGYQDRSSPSYAEPNGGWKWVTGEPFVLNIAYMGTNDIFCTMTVPGFDDCPAGTCDYCGCGTPGAQDALFFTGCCNNVLDDVGDGVVQNCDSVARAGIIEWSADCNNDGIVDYGQIRAGTLLDTNQNNIPDCCEGGASCSGEAVEWRTQDGGNGHWYAVRLGNASFDLARQQVEAIGGYLATITSASEQQFIGNSVAPGVSFLNAWMGLVQDPGSPEPAGGWRWVTGEPLGAYSNWYSNPQQPDNSACGMGAAENFCMWAKQWNGTWADVAGIAFPSPGCESVVSHSLIEWSADCNNDGVVDYGQIREGELTDSNRNNVPDCCEQGMPCPVPPRQWTGAGSNGHWYAVAINPAGDVHWRFDEAVAYAQARGAHLATFSDQQENVGVYNLLRLGAGYFAGWFGLAQTPGSSEPAGGWGWITGEPLTFSYWQPGEPNNTGCYQPSAPQNWGTLEGNQAGGNTEGRWDDDGDPVPACQSRVVRAVIEWSADCNNDGVVDFGQIRAGQLADSDSDGTPDICEFITVPTDFPTVQAAIDSVAAGSQRVIQLLSGTYNQAFSLNGKNVVVRGAADGSTILDGTGLTSSIVRMSNEPSSAGLENLVFRNGIAGSRFTPETTFTVGGAVYANSTAAFIRNCRFENCRADFGGAIYQLFGTFTWEGCVFSGNIAINDGGAAQAYNCTGTLRSCTFSANRCGMIGSGSGSGFKAIGSNGAGESVTLDSCVFTGNIAGDSGSAVEFYEHVKSQPGVLRLVGTTITGNISGEPFASGAGGLRVLGQLPSCIIDGATIICQNSQRNVSGPYLVTGAPTICDCLADLSGDGVVNGGDLGLLLSAWGTAGPTGAGDVNHDGLIDGADLSMLLSSWGICN